MSNSARLDPIEHVVVLMQENHSFDQMLGALTAVYPGMTGIDPSNLRVNLDDKGRSFRQMATTERQMFVDPRHEVDHVHVQMDGGNAGFVRDFAQSYPNCTAEELQFVMGYYPLDFLPALHGLARDFLICDRWFSSVPGPTWPNRFFALTGTAIGRVNMPHDGKNQEDLGGYFQQNQVTLFDRLRERKIHWRVYFHDVPVSWVLEHQREPANSAHYHSIDNFYTDVQGPADQFPAFTYIEPRYQGIDENDDHPPHDVMKGQKLVADVYNALRANEELWSKTLFIVTYDEHGGFYDQVVPPAAVPPDEHHDEYTFDQLGIRVPTLLISPWVKRGYDSTVFDHTSVLRYLIDKWALGPLGERAARANSIAALIGDMDEPRTDTVSRIELTAEQLQPPDPDANAKTGNIVSDFNREAALLLYAQLDHDIPLRFGWLSRRIQHIKRFFRCLGWLKPLSDADLLGRYKQVQSATGPIIDRSRSVSGEQLQVVAAPASEKN